MKKTVLVEIECGEDTCEDCHAQEWVGDKYGTPHCAFFDVRLTDIGELRLLRCPECKRREVPFYSESASDSVMENR